MNAKKADGIDAAAQTLDALVNAVAAIPLLRDQTKASTQCTGAARRLLALDNFNSGQLITRP